MELNLVKDMYPKDRYFTNVMRLELYNNPLMVQYVKPTLRNAKCIFPDGSVYFQKVEIMKTFSIKTDSNKLYIDEDCTIPAEVTRKQKLYECRRLGLIG